MSERNKELIRRRIDEAWHQGRLEAIGADATPAYVIHDPSIPGGQADAVTYREHIRTSRTGFPDVRITVEDQIAEGDRVATRLSATGTHLGEIWGLKPTGKTVTVVGILIDRFEGGLVAESWIVPDNLSMLQQLGVVPDMASSTAQ
jgi:predicted ester cyclase